MIHGYRFTALGCTGHIRLASLPKAQADQHVVTAVRWLRGIEAELSRFVSTSLVSQLNRGEEITSSDNLRSVLALAQQAQQQTVGRFSIAAGSLWQMWHDPLRTHWPSAEEIASAQKNVQYSCIETAPNKLRLSSPYSCIDLGGVGKEWCVDQLIELLTKAGVENVLVELGGDCAARGHQPHHTGWQVLMPGVAAAVTLKNEAIATSGIGTRGRYLDGHWVSHVINAVTGLPAPGVVRSASVISSQCAQAGIYATDLCLLPDVSTLLISAYSGGCPVWLRLRDGAWWADQQMATKLIPVTNTAVVAA